MLEQKKQQELKAVLEKYANQEASLAEQKAVDHWYNTLHEENQQLFIAPGSKALVEQNIKRHIYVQTAKRNKFKPLYIKYAAACFLFLALGVIWFNYHPHVPETPHQEMRISSERGERKKIVLADGSEVLLNAQSELRVSHDFGETDRKIILNGEAYFKVAKDKTRPFIIQSGVLQTRVLGTSFNISAYTGMERIKISVLTGKVMVSKLEGAHLKLLAKGMTTDQTISFYKSNSSFELKTENAELLTSWKENKLYIDNASIADIAEQLARYYNVEVKNLSKKNNKDKYTIRFNHESMKGVLEILTALTKRKFTYSNHRIMIK